MSNALAPAAVTTTLSTRFVGLLNTFGVTGMSVTLGHPKADAEPGIYLQLYRVTPNPALRNHDLPSRSADGEPLGRPRLALDLHYLMTFVGEVDTIDAERLMGLILTDLHAHPLLTADEIDDAIAATAVSNPVRGSDLSRQEERVRVLTANLSLEDHARLWGLLNQSFHALTVALQVGPVLLDGELPTALALPVRSLGALTVATRRPVILRASGQSTGQPLVTLGETLQLDGTDLVGSTVRLRMGPVVETIPRASITPSRLLWTVAGASLTPGVHPVTVEHLDVWPADGSLRVVTTSAPVAVGLAPVLGAPILAGAGATRTLTLPLTPAAAADQVVELLLSQGGTRTSLRATSVTPAGAVFTVGTRAGAWEMRAVVDGVASLPAVVADAWSLPVVNL